MAYHVILSRNANVPTVPASAGIPNLGGPIRTGATSRASRAPAIPITTAWSFHSTNAPRDGPTCACRIRCRKRSTTPATSSSRACRTTSTSETIAVCLTTISVIASWSAVHSKRRSKAKPTASQRALRGFQFGYIFTYGSRLPFNVLLGSDRNLDTNNNDRPLGVGRNTGRGFDFASLDLRVSRKFRI